MGSSNGNQAPISLRDLRLQESLNQAELAKRCQQLDGDGQVTICTISELENGKRFKNGPHPSTRELLKKALDIDDATFHTAYLESIRRNGSKQAKKKWGLCENNHE